MNHTARLLLVVAGLLALSSCGSDELVGEIVPNTAPDTQVEATPPNLGATSFRIEFYWSGSDPDGEIAYFEWIITDNGPDNVFSPTDTMRAWNRTDATDSVFVVSADLPDFDEDVDNEQITNIQNVRFWQTHTFFVRAVDAEGASDPTPAHVSFTATTLTPRVKITEPRLTQSSSCSDGPLALTFKWQMSDPDNDAENPGDVRYTLIKWGDPGDPCLTDIRYRELEPIRDIPEDRWSPWISYDAGNDSGRVKSYPVSDQPAGTSFLFAVQARDVSGAVTPVFTFGNNVRHVKTTTQKFPLLTVTETNLGTERAVAKGSIARFELIAAQPLSFEWLGDASSYGGFVEEYRYGFNVEDPENEEDPNWAVPWGPSWRTAKRSGGFTSGAPNFVVQARDNSGSISRLIYQFQVVQVKPRADQRPLLLIDDSNESSDRRIDTLFDVQWENNLLSVQGFSTASDIVDVTGQSNRLSFSRVNEYRAVIWLVSSEPTSYLATRLAPLNTNDVRFNWLEIYQKFVGNVMLVGPRAMRNSIEPLADRNMIYPIVFNISDGGNKGLGTAVNAEGVEVNVGALRYPYTGWCLESIDEVDPVNVGKPNNPRGRALECDSYTYARVAAEYVDRYRPSPTRVGNLHPLNVRINAGFTPDLSELAVFQQLSMQAEEFYNRNAPNRPLVLSLRNCQVPMYEAIARMDVDEVEVIQPLDRDEVYHYPERASLTNDARCPAVFNDNRRFSTVTGAPIVIASTQYVDTKQNGSVPFEDYLWGFNPLSFERSEVKDAVEWILLNQWALNEE